MCEILAAADKYTRLYVWLGVLWLLIVVLGLAVWYYRRRWQLSEPDSEAVPWTLADLRDLRNSGELTEEEYQKLRSAIIGGLRPAAADRQTGGPSSTTTRPPSESGSDKG